MASCLCDGEKWALVLVGASLASMGWGLPFPLHLLPPLHPEGPLLCAILTELDRCTAGVRHVAPLGSARWALPRLNGTSAEPF